MPCQKAVFTRPGWHLVYIRLERNEKVPRRLAIRIRSKGTEDEAHWLTPNQHSGTVTFKERMSTTPRIVRELGWFKNVEQFKQLCQSQPVPAGAQDNTVLELWIEDLLQELVTNYEDVWILNNGCS